MSKLSLHQQISQQHLLSPQMRKNLEVLQAPVTELNTLVLQELSVNPVLEEISNEENLEIPDSEITEDDYLTQESEDSWKESQIHESQSQVSREDSTAKYQFLYDSIVTPKSLQEHLSQQLSTTDTNKETKELTQTLMGYLDQNGFLEIPLSEISEQTHISLKKWKEAKKILQSFDPIGIGGENLQESLLIQLKELPNPHPLSYKLLKNYFDLFSKRKFTEISKILSVSPDSLHQACKIIQTLSPCPAIAFQAGNNPQISPDILVEKKLKRKTKSSTN